MKSFVIAFLLGMGVIIGGCKKPAPAPAPAPQPSHVVVAPVTKAEIKESDAGIVTSGPVLKVAVDEDPSVPTKWLIDSKPSHLKLTEETKNTWNQTSETRHFTFDVKSGEGDLVLVLKDNGGYGNVVRSVTFHVVGPLQ